MNNGTHRVEGHGSELTMIGGVTTAASPYRNSPLLTREQAWSVARGLMTCGRYHTIKVYVGGTVVFRACRLVDGTYLDMRTGEPVKAVKVAA